MIPKIDLNKFDYNLPDELIALYPTTNRGESRLLRVDAKDNTINNFNFSDISNLLPKDSLLFINDTKVISARIFMQKITGSKIELLLFEPANKQKDFQIGLSEFGVSKWKCIVGGKVKVGALLNTQVKGRLNLSAEIISKDGNEVLVCFNWDNIKISFAEILIEYGNIPLPPYIKRVAKESDLDRYQTVFANILGSVAAPTAGLHFNDKILNEIDCKNIKVNKLTLHISLGTFKPINSDSIENHKMHNEQFCISKSVLINLASELKKENPKVTATGTTSTRTLESLYWIGIKIILNHNLDINFVEISQWDSYNLNQQNLPSAFESISIIISELDKNNLDLLSGQTEMIILPGYKFRIINGLITNFHAPHSTLILLVAGFLGFELWKKSYQFAVDNSYRFLSYGDSSYLSL